MTTSAPIVACRTDAAAGGHSSASRGSTLFVRMVKPQFATLVLSGEKTQTVRPTPKRMMLPGDTISLRMWTGKPYRSKQRILREATVLGTDTVRVHDTGIMLHGEHLPLAKAWCFAKADGFNTLQDMLEWFNVTHGLPFEGIVIYWSNGESSDRPSNKEKS